MDCPNCQTPLREGAQFCTRCGARTSAADSVPTAARGGGARGGAAGALEGRVLDGKYEIVGRLGEGGMGAVYRARRVHIGDEVAVKVLHTKYVGDPLLVERFRREARAAAQLHHPNVVTIHDYGEARGEEGFAYIVMELARGVSLRELLRREGRLTVGRAASLMGDICAGVGAAHRREIVHRDLKPDNIIVAPADDDHDRERVKVVDFGIAKLRDMASDSALTQAGSMIGTPFYMSPEQCRGESLDARADVYSLGALLYEMLAGAPPFTAPTVTGVIAKHLTEPPPPLPEHSGAPPALQAAVARALSKDPAARQRDAAEFAREVQAAAAQTAAAPPPPTAPGPFFPATGQPVTPTTPQPTHTGGAPVPQTFGQNLPAQTYAPPPVQGAPPRKSRAPFYLVLSVAVIAALAAFAGGGLYFIGRQEQKKKKANANALARRPPATPANANAAKPTPGVSPVKVDPAAVRREVGQALDEWTKSTRARDLGAHARCYADTLETFYQKQNVPAAQVLADRARAFTRYDTIAVDLDNVEITPDATGARATAVFDKTWEFEADDKTSTGSVRQQLTLVRLGGRWVITGEKDLQVHSKTSEEY